MSWWRFKLFLLFLFAASVVQGQSLPYARHWVDTLSAPVFAGRGYVNDGQQLAADAIAREFYRLGLQSVGNDYKQWFSLDVNSFPDTVGLRINGKVLQPGIHYLVHPLSQAGTAKGVKPGKGAEIIARNQSAERLAKGPQQPLLIETTDGPLIWSVGRDAGPQVRFLVHDSLMPAKVKRIDYIVNSQFKSFRQANVVGLIPGSSRPDSFILITAHYDHLGMMGRQCLFPGAHDNASGTAMMLDLARHYSQPENSPAYSILFIAFGAEEAGLVGSRYFVEEDPLVPLSAIRFVINLDLMGGGSDGITVVNAPKHPEAFTFLEKRNAEKQALRKVVARENTANSDHYPFSKRGVAAFFLYTLGDVTAYHNPLDKAEALPFSRYEAVFGLIADFADYLQGR